MNLSKIDYVNLLKWKGSFPTIFNKEIKKELTRRHKLITRLPENKKLSLAARIISSGASRGRETIDDVFLSLKLVGLTRNQDLVNRLYNKAFGIKDIYNHLSPSCQKKIKK
jgi:hypothetical protein